ncbi:hypothetical protein OG394_35285 [Kribbella sp. NBC_01245]|uniref:hypothetical protein n=1 Tax=Kribbella sp. NBC_01245 TaxID=2903578 RepID=UPI002E2A43BE|nr:hypothetical protein [Kribbella sp. NBC_01245]
MTPDVWEAEFNRDGQVVLPLRPRSQILPLASIVLLAGMQAFLLIIEVTDFSTWTWTWHWNFWVISCLFLLLVWAPLFALVPLRKMIRRLPAVTISRHGVQKGRRSVSWSQVRRIDHRLGGPVRLRTDRWPLRIDAEHTADPHALAWWLQTVLERARVR